MDAAEYKVPCHQGRSQVRGTVAFGIAMRGYKELGAPRRCWRSCGCSHLRSPLALPFKLAPLPLLLLLLLLSSKLLEGSCSSGPICSKDVAVEAASHLVTV